MTVASDSVEKFIKFLTKNNCCQTLALLNQKILREIEAYPGISQLINYFIANPEETVLQQEAHDGNSPNRRP